MGLTRMQTLRQVELPLAVPAIIGGLRVAVVSTVAIATIAAFLLPDGLGYPIVLALKEPTPFKTEIYSAGALAVAFALTLRPAARRAAPGARPVGGQGSSHDVSRTPPTRTRSSTRSGSSATTRGFLLQKALEQLELSGRGARRSRSSSRCRSASCSAISTAAPASRSERRSSGAPCRASS